MWMKGEGVVWLCFGRKVIVGILDARQYLEEHNLFQIYCSFFCGALDLEKE
jgi:hypothetical protein